MEDDWLKRVEDAAVELQYGAADAAKEFAGTTYRPGETLRALADLLLWYVAAVREERAKRG